MELIAGCGEDMLVNGAMEDSVSLIRNGANRILLRGRISKEQSLAVLK